MTQPFKDPHPVDVFVGQRLQQARLCGDWSQEQLGKAVGVSLQQIQKYEKAVNRISASRLYEFSRIFNVDVNFFFDGCELSIEPTVEQPAKLDDIELARMIARLPTARAKGAIAAIIEDLARLYEKDRTFCFDKDRH